MADGNPQPANPTPEQPSQPASQPVMPAAAEQVQQSADTAKKAAEQGVEATKAAVQQGADAAKHAAAQVSGGLQQGMDQLKKMDVQQMFKAAANQPKVTQEERFWGGIAYIPMVALMSLLLKPDSAYVRLHGRQGLLMFLIFFVCIFLYLVPFIGPLFGGLIQLALFIVGIFSMYQAFVGNWWKIPVLGDLADQIPIDLFTKVTTEAITGQVAEQKGPAQAAPPQEQTMPMEQPKEAASQEQKNPPAEPVQGEGNNPPAPQS